MKFQFTVEFQYDLLRFTVQDKNGYKAILLYDDTYFTLTEHSVLAFTLKHYYRKRKVIPGKVMFIEELNKTFDHKDFINNLTDEDRKEILSLAHGLWKGVVKDGDEIIKKAEKFTQYVDLKHEIENVNLLDYEHYDSFSRKIQKAISPRLQNIEEKGNFLLKDIKHRQARRKEGGSIIPMPWTELDRKTNAGGYARGSILVVLDKAKKFKTGVLINIARRYLQYQKKNVLIIDLDNGEDEFLMRIEQSIAGVSKADLLDERGSADKKVRESLKKTKRIGGELVLKRFPSLITTASDISTYIDYLYREFGFQTEILIVDYIGKMGCVSGKESLHERISEAYIDISNLALEKKLDLVWTAQHVTKDAAKNREEKVYESTDVAGATDITRHVQALYGLNRTKEEEKNEFLRMEIIDQRDGPPMGNVVFKVDMLKQRMAPAKGKILKEYEENYQPESTEPEDNSYRGSKKRKKQNDLEDAE